MMSMFCADPWLYEVVSTGRKEVSLRLSKPTPNSIWGVVQEPKSPMLLDAAVTVPASAAEPQSALVAAASLAVEVTDDEAADDSAVDEESDEATAAEEPVPLETTLPWSSMAAWLAKSVVIPKTALNASACAPVFTAAALDAVTADWHVAFAVSSALQELVNVSHINWVMMSMF